MCIAILNTYAPLKRDYLNNSWANNSQGAGLLYNLDGRLRTFKTYNKKKFIKEYYRIRELVSGNIVLHFRIATSGYEKYTNLHPFMVNDKLGFVHNGVIPKLGDSQYSDTYYFNEKLKQMHPDFLTCKKSIKHIEKQISGSKLLFLDASDNYTIINEAAGVWDGADWFSNNSYKRDLDYYYYGNTKVYKSTKQSAASDFDFDFDLDYKHGQDEDSHYFNVYMSFYTNVNESTIWSIERLTGCTRYTSEFAQVLEDFSFICGSIDLRRILEAIESEKRAYKSILSKPYQVSGY
jgi:predicted glutamine amidotransferase